jgi:hypothetical protein
LQSARLAAVVAELELGFTVIAPAEFAEMAQHVFSLEGGTVFYIEKMLLFRIAVTEVKAREDGQGFDAIATVIPTHGLANNPKSWIFGAGWESFHATPDVVKSTYGGWRIYTDPAVMQELTEILKPLSANSTYFDVFRSESVERGGPGSVADRLCEFLDNLNAM